MGYSLYWTEKWIVSLVIAASCVNLSTGQFSYIKLSCHSSDAEITFCSGLSGVFNKSVINIKSMSFRGVLASDEASLPNIPTVGCTNEDQNQTLCTRVAENAGTGLEGVLKYTYDYILAACQHQNRCNFTIPEWWVAKGPMGCGQRTAYLLDIVFDYDCIEGANFTNETRVFPPSTPSWVTTTISEEEELSRLIVPLLYDKPLSDVQKIILAVAIGVGVVTLFVVLIVFICYDMYRKKRNEAKQHMKEQRPKRQKSWFDTVKMFAMGTAWKDVDDEAMGEHTGFKPDEFLTIDRTLDRGGRGAPPQYGNNMQNCTLPRKPDGSKRQLGPSHGNSAYDGGQGMGYNSATLPAAPYHSEQEMYQGEAGDQDRYDFSTLPAPPSADMFDRGNYDHYSQSGTLNVNTNVYPTSEAMEY